MDYQKLQKLMQLDKVHEIYEGILERKECVSLKTLAVTGKDLIAAGMKPGKELGEVLQKMLEHVIEEPEHNTKEYLVETWLDKYQK